MLDKKAAEELKRAEKPHQHHICGRGPYLLVRRPHAVRMRLSRVLGSMLARTIREMVVRGSTGKRRVTRSIPERRALLVTACYSVLMSQAGCNGRATSPPQGLAGARGSIHICIYTLCIHSVCLDPLQALRCMEPVPHTGTSTQV